MGRFDTTGHSMPKYANMTPESDISDESTSAHLRLVTGPMATNCTGKTSYTKGKQDSDHRLSTAIV
jgi:hypothetical protein